MLKIGLRNKERTANPDHWNDLNRSQSALKKLNRKTRNLNLFAYSNIAAVKTTLAFPLELVFLSKESAIAQTNSLLSSTDLAKTLSAQLKLQYFDL